VIRFVRYCLVLYVVGGFLSSLSLFVYGVHALCYQRNRFALAVVCIISTTRHCPFQSLLRNHPLPWSLLILIQFLKFCESHTHTMLLLPRPFVRRHGPPSPPKPPPKPPRDVSFIRTVHITSMNHLDVGFNLPHDDFGAKGATAIDVLNENINV
jgi:hypothetical protein